MADTTIPAEAADSSRDPLAVAELALRQWCDWHPGDGSRYRVHIERIRGGSDADDLVLLLNIQRRTIAFQWAPALYRHLEGDRWTKRHCKDLGIPSWAWRAARPLLEVMGATRRADAVKLLRSVETVELPEPAAAVLGD